MNRTQILSNIQSLTAEQLFEFICQGLVTLDELRDTGNLDVTKRKNIQNLQIERDQNDDNLWERCRFENEAGIRDYISQYPSGRHTEDAKSLILDLQKQLKRIAELRNKNIQRIKSNEVTPDLIQDYLAKGIIDDDDLQNECQIPNEIIKSIKDYRPLDIKLGSTPSSIPNGFTEVYFWGIPTSGKTCALSTILNTAHKNGYMQTGQGEGLRYLHTLKNLFKNENGIGYLPEGTADKTQYLPFTLSKPNEKHSRSVSLIELSGEIFKCFAKKNMGEDLASLKDTFDTLDIFLKGKNRKIHFFFIDYEPTSLTQDTFTQSDYLEEASKYFTKNKIFSESTDAIYVVITKSDLIDGYKKNDGSLRTNINKYMSDHFKSFDKYL